MGPDQSVTVLVRSDGLIRPRVGPALNEVNDRFLPNQTVQLIFIFIFFPLIKTTSFWCFWHQNDFVLITIKVSLFFLPPPAAANLTRYPSPQPWLPLPVPQPITASASSAKPPCYCRWRPPRPLPQLLQTLPTAQAAPARPPASRRQCWFCRTRWSSRTRTFWWLWR